VGQQPNSSGTARSPSSLFRGRRSLDFSPKIRLSHHRKDTKPSHSPVWVSHVSVLLSHSMHITSTRPSHRVKLLVLARDISSACAPHRRPCANLKIYQPLPFRGPPYLKHNLACSSAPTPSTRQHRSFTAGFLPRLFHRPFSSSQPRHTKLQAVLGEADEMDAYNFPDARLKKKLNDPSKTPLLLVACGSFSPITFLHLRMFVMADDYVKHNTNYEVIGGYLSPVSDAYRKQGLALADHRYATILGLT
jgi:hypothetical protein